MSTNPLEISIPELTGNEKEYLIECINSNYVSSVGPYIERFEKSISNYIELPSNCVTATNSATSALHLGLLALGVSKKDIVIIPNYTFIATANAVANSGATPWLIDILSDSLTINAELLESELEKNTYLSNGYRYHKLLHKRVYALIPVHIFGYAPDLDSLNNIVHKYNLNIICDAAGGLGSTYKNNQLGKVIENGVISFNGNKIITCGGGGIFFSKNKYLVEKVKHLASTARKSSNYIHDQIGFNFRMSNLHAAVGLAQLERLDLILKKRKEITKTYQQAFKNNTYFSFLIPDSYTISSNWLNVILVNKDIKFKMSDFIEDLNKKNINIRHYWSPISMQEPYRNCPMSDQHISLDTYMRIIVLPSSTNLTSNDIEHTINTVNNYFRK